MRLESTLLIYPEGLRKRLLVYEGIGKGKKQKMPKIKFRCKKIGVLNRPVYVKKKMDQPNLQALNTSFC